MKKIKSILALFIVVMLITSCKKNFRCGDTITDIDGNVYNTVNIGNQCWMQENLKTRHYNDGTELESDLTNLVWSNITTGAYCFYDENADNDAVYGKLYNWLAVKSNKIAPKGWHVPSDAEWTKLIDNLGGQLVAGNKMKSTTQWREYIGITNTNSSGFTALPAGTRFNNGSFTTMGEDCAFWSSTEFDSNDAYLHSLSFAQPSISRFTYGSKISGFSIRCVKD